MTDLSKTQIDRLGDRLRKGNLSDDDLQLLDHYRKSFGEAYAAVTNIIHSQLGLESSGRPAKSTSSIIEKLRRESIRLSQIQDIAGSRIIVNDIYKQEEITQSLKNVFPAANTIDRRKTPSHGYRAVHLIINIDKKLVEIQIRTKLQHAWAELSEKLSDNCNPTIKYGGGDKILQTDLLTISKIIATNETLVFEITNSKKVPLSSTLLILKNAIEKSNSEIIFNLNKIIKQTSQSRRAK